MFDPFRDFATAGYLRNRFAEKDSKIVQELEHQMFRASLEEAITHLSRRRGALRYEDFLAVHRILFEGFYPWAGEDRATTAPDIAVTKAGTWFCHPAHARLAVQEGLRIGNDRRLMRQRPGEVTGLFAYGHPFLDGNGRTMLVVHTELCHRAGFCIEWHRTSKSAYLTALSDEIATPGKGILDNYLLPFVGEGLHRQVWGGMLNGLPGLDGQGPDHAVAGNYANAEVSDQYREFERRRDYRIGR
ncbi:Fic/DOC family protein [Roseateles terrae]|uniref:protein adenylyltransferase n=1 Tax=Roseateles terrae TaxID=431060 RepID=A0ABR6GP32_9BURK|nr:Fic family protein [Roseateles terrae]MBB3193452.1 cell filamentation protein [Roseateles terrae]OWQ89364.1 cell filamentation protein Fic [Roseateles terrae]